jgi:hypothetical protein
MSSQSRLWRRFGSSCRPLTSACRLIFVFDSGPRLSVMASLKLNPGKAAVRAGADLERRCDVCGPIPLTFR